MKNEIVVFFYLFVNLYFPISPMFCTGVDCLFALYFIKEKDSKIVNQKITVLAFLLLVVAFFSYILSSNPELQVLFKYSRTLIATIVIIISAKAIDIEISKFVNCISVLLLLHVLMIGVQVIYPPVSEMIAPYFNFSREMDVLQEMKLRKMGLSGGYDSAAMLVVLAVILYYYQFYYKEKWIYFFLSLLSMGMVLFVSRLGLIMVACVLLYFVVKSIKKSGKVRLAGMGLAIVGAVVLIYILLPILAATNALIFDISINPNVDVSYFVQDYSSANGSAGRLTGEFLLCLNDLNLFEWLLGAGNSSDSDIGYVQIIFQVGLVGLYFVVIIHMLMLHQIKSMKFDDVNFNVMKTFFVAYMVILFVFNYKVLLLYSRGFYDFILVCFVYMISNQRRFGRNKMLVIDSGK